MRAPCSILLAVLATGCGAKTALEVEPPADAGRPDVFAFDTFTCRWSYGAAPRVIASTPADWTTRPLRASIHPDRDVGVVAVSGDRFVAFSLSGDALGEVSAPGASFAWGGAEGWRLLRDPGSGECEVEARDWGLRELRDGRPLLRSPCGFDPMGDEVAIVSWPPVSVSAIPASGSLGGRLVGGRVEVAPETAPRVARDRDGRAWVSAASGGRFLLTVLSSPAIVELGPASDAPPLAPDRLRGGVVAAIGAPDGVHLVRAFLGGASIEVVELSVAAPDPGVRPEIVTNETEVLFARSDGSVEIVPLSGAAPRRLPSPEPGAGRGAVALRDGTSAGALVYPIATGAGTELRMRPMVCNR